MASWFEIFRGEGSLYLSVACIVSLALMAVEIVLVKLRERAILGHLGWREDDPSRD